MRSLSVDGTVVASVVVADSFRTRLRGLIGRRSLPEALLLQPSASVHGVGMLQAVEVAVLSRTGEVLHVQVLRPFAMTWPRRGAASVLEAPVGSFARWRLAVGSSVTVGPSGAHGPGASVTQ